MNWTVIKARNEEWTLQLDNHYIYSKYRPREDAWKWVESEFDSSKDSYLLIGLGLGYHLEKLAELAKGKPVFVLYFESEEINLFTKYNNVELNSCVKLLQDLSTVNIDNGLQVLLPNVWIKALGDHALIPYLEDIKINQVTYKKSAEIMKENFLLNTALSDFHEYPSFSNKNAALVASGPSLNETVNWLKEVEDKIEIFVVGSALKVLLANNIQPSAVVIIDPKPNIINQLENIDYDGLLFYLSTANHQAILQHKGKRFILLQQGYEEAEKLARIKGLPLVETGGSVSTTTLSLLEILNFKNIFLFGLDLGFKGEHTHANLSTSGRKVQKEENLREVLSNSGDIIFTPSNLHTYLRWFNAKMERTILKVYNTSWNGAKINKVPYINKQQLYQLLQLENL